MQDFEHIKVKNIKMVRFTLPCSWCAEEIRKGESAVYRVYKFQGDFHAEYMHPECFEAMEKDGDGEFEFGMFKRGTAEIK